MMHYDDNIPKKPESVREEGLSTLLESTATIAMPIFRFGAGLTTLALSQFMLHRCAGSPSYSLVLMSFMCCSVE